MCLRPQRIFARAFLASLFLWGGSTGCGEKFAESIVATVDGTPIGIAEVNERYARLERELQAQAASPREDATQLKRAVLAELVNRKLLLREAAARKLAVAPAEVEAEEKRLLASLSEEEQSEIMSGARTTPERFREALREDLLLGKLNALISAEVSVSEPEIQAAYEQGKVQFFQQESVHARQIVVDTEAETRTAKRRLALGEDFAKVAREMSQSPDAANGGDLGFFSRGEMPGVLEEWAFQLKPGQTSPVIETPYGFHILKVEELKPARQLELAEVRETLSAQILGRKREERYKELLSTLREKARIAYNRKYAELKPNKK